MATNSYAQHVKNVNVTDPKNEYAFKNTNATLKLYLILVSLVQSEMPLASPRAQRLTGTFLFETPYHGHNQFVFFAHILLVVGVCRDPNLPLCSLEMLFWLPPPNTTKLIFDT